MNKMGYEVNRDIDNQYQQYHGEPVQDTLMEMFIMSLVVLAFIMALVVIGYWSWKLFFREKKIKSYTGGEN
jgi:hypothetical protein